MSQMGQNGRASESTLAKAPEDGVSVADVALVYSSVRNVESKVPAQNAGATLIDFLSARFTYRTRAQWQQCILSGGILLNGVVTSADAVLRTGDVVKLVLRPELMREPQVNTNYSVVAVEAQYLIINKPSNLPVHPSGRYFNNTLLRLLLPRFGSLFPVNRIDRETSGITVFAKDKDAASKLGTLFSAGKVQKTYLALVYGEMKTDCCQADGFLFRDADSQIHKKQRFSTVQPKNVPFQTASTTFRPLEYKNGLTLVKCIPHTGRTHQIRATLLALGFPIVGDKLYGLDETIFLRFREDKLTSHDRELLKMDSQALHASEIQFISPFNGEECRYTAPCPFSAL